MRRAPPWCTGVEYRRVNNELELTQDEGGSRPAQLAQGRRGRSALLAGLGAATPGQGGRQESRHRRLRRRRPDAVQGEDHSRSPRQQGFDIQFLEDEYGVTLEKLFADAQSGAGQYDLYLLDDPWVPQFGAAEVLEDLGAAGIDGADKDWIKPLIDMGYWPPREGPAGQGLRERRRRS